MGRGVVLMEQKAPRWEGQRLAVTMTQVQRVNHAESRLGVADRGTWEVTVKAAVVAAHGGLRLLCCWE